MTEDVSVAAPEPVIDLRLATITREHCIRVFEGCDGKVRPTARALDIGYTTLYRWLKEWGVELRGDQRERARGGDGEGL